MATIRIPSKPHLKFNRKTKRPRSFRIHDDLLDRLKLIAAQKGYGLSELVETVLDGYASTEDVKD